MAKRSPPTSCCDGPADASRMLIVISGVHGVEGFCGSAIQTGMLLLETPDGGCPARHRGAVRARDQSLRLLAPASRHAGEHRPQPQLRRFLEAPAGQRRLCRDPRPAAAGGVAAAGRKSKPRSRPTANAMAHAACSAPSASASTPTPTACSSAAMGRPGATTPSAASCGATPPQVRQLASIDIHTGLGPYGVGERIFASFDDDPAVLARGRALVGRTDLGHHRHLDQHSADRPDPDARSPRNAPQRAARRHLPGIRHLAERARHRRTARRALAAPARQRRRGAAPRPSSRSSRMRSIPTPPTGSSRCGSKARKPACGRSKACRKTRRQPCWPDARPFSTSITKEPRRHSMNATTMNHAACRRPPSGARSAPPAPRTAISRKAVAAAVAGNALEFYDFVIYAYFAVYIGRTFFPVSGEFGSLLVAVATFGVGFFTRPLGGVLIGAFADRAGRKPAMILTVALITVGTLGLAATPSYASIGIAAPDHRRLLPPAAGPGARRRSGPGDRAAARSGAARRARLLLELADREPGPGGRGGRHASAWRCRSCSRRSSWLPGAGACRSCSAWCWCRSRSTSAAACPKPTKAAANAPARRSSVPCSGSTAASCCWACF